jgi:hypothetical protein
VSGDEKGPLPESPYRGLEPYRYCDRAIFFERESETERLIRLTTMYRGALLYGESGAGKSSLINAGLIPRLVAEGTVVERLRVQPRRGREIVVERIARAGQGSELLPSILAGTPEDGATVISADDFPARVRAAAATKLLIIFDQFEELLTLTSEGAQDSDASHSRNRILDSIVSLLQDRKIHHARFLFVFREEYLAKFERFFYFCPDLPDQFLRLTPPRAHALRRLIRGPFESDHIPKGHWKQELSEDVATALEEKLRPAEDGTPINLSQVQIVVLQLWRSEKPAAILEARGVDGLVSDYLRDQLAMFRKDQPTAETLLSLMITLHGTRKIVEAAELVEQARALKVAPEKTGTTIEKLVSETRLVRRDYNRGATTYEIVSEFLVPWIRALKLRRVARDLRILWMRRALGLIGIVALVLSSIFMVRFQATTVQAQKDRLVEEATRRASVAEQQLVAAQNDKARAEKEAKNALDTLSKDEGGKYKSLTDQLNSSRDAASKARDQVLESALQITNLKAQADKSAADLQTSNQNLAAARTLIHTITKSGEALQARIDALTKASPTPAQNTASGSGTTTPPRPQTAGPVPPPAAPLVDIMSKLLSDSEVKDIFGSNLNRNYYVYQLTVRNTSGSAVFFRCEGFSEKGGMVVTPREPASLTLGLTASQTVRIFSMVKNEYVVQNNAAMATAVFIPRAALTSQPQSTSLTPVYSAAAISSPQVFEGQHPSPSGTSAQKNR